MNNEMPQESEASDAVAVLRTTLDGKVGTVLRPTEDDCRYMIVLEDGREAILNAGDLSLRHLASSTSAATESRLVGIRQSGPYARTWSRLRSSSSNPYVCTILLPVESASMVRASAS